MRVPCLEPVLLCQNKLRFEELCPWLQFRGHSEAAAHPPGPGHTLAGGENSHGAQRVAPAPTAPPDGLWVPPLQKGLERVASGKVTLARDRFL